MSDKGQNCKVVLLGESGVGKTCIISRYVNNTYDEKSETTNGASYASKVIEFDEYKKSFSFRYFGYSRSGKISFPYKIFL